MPRSAPVEETSQNSNASRYVVGIDLGTTNSAVAYFDTWEESPSSQIFSIEQLVAPAEVESRETLPSFHYQAAVGEFPAEALKLPWSKQSPEVAVGFFARDQGTKSPGRLVVSAKSWLSHAGVDRTAKILPWQGSTDLERLSPVEVTARYLEHLREAWDFEHPEHPLAEQDLMLTLPASFDEVARELTVKAAAQAGLPKIILLEEPQAAFYAWLDRQGENWEEQVSPGQTILVCDIGGGTTDFTLIRVRGDSDNRVQFHRVAVGDHLILGGDNLDLTLATHLEARLVPKGKLTARQWSVLVRTCRQVKETLLGENPPDSYKIHLPGSGSKLLGGGLVTEVTKDEVEQWLLEGFVPKVKWEENPQRRSSGFQEFGLPYAADAAMTRYLAQFLRMHQDAGVPLEETSAQSPSSARPDLILFNGGFFESSRLRNRLLEVISSWFTSADDKEPWFPTVLDNDRLDLAVARGAAYYGMVRRGAGVRINAGLARTYYLGVAGTAEMPRAALSLLPAGLEEGQQIDLTDRTFELRIREPVEFPFYVSSTRLTDPAGELVAFDPEQMRSLPPIRTVLQTGKKKGPAESVQVQLHAKLTEIGTMEVWCAEIDGKNAWRLQFDVRSGTETDREAHHGTAEQAGFLDQEVIEAAHEVLQQTFPLSQTSDNSTTIPPEQCVNHLEEAIGENRWKWPPSLLRDLWQDLLELETARKLSMEHEARWLNLLGFCLRPGLGLAADDWRVSQTWRLLQSGQLHYPKARCRTELWILWRRLAGGLTSGQQIALAEPLLSRLHTNLKAKTKGSSKSNKRKNRRGKPQPGGDLSVFEVGAHETAEIWRMLGALEWLPMQKKMDIGQGLLALFPKEPRQAVQHAQLWALARIGARVPLYGPLNGVLLANVVSDWIEILLQHASGDSVARFTMTQLARRTNDRYRDLSENSRDRVLGWLDREEATADEIKLVESGGDLDAEEQDQIFGESLPPGLHLVS
ncbi:Molecular chaperone DnaK [Planctomycetales bacterium 10988]|nr:Molecular chaperone DnaK [Planctomycetales bacterium 10988]